MKSSFSGSLRKHEHNFRDVNNGRVVKDPFVGPCTIRRYPSGRFPARGTSDVPTSKFDFPHFIPIGAPLPFYQVYIPVCHTPLVSGAVGVEPASDLAPIPDVINTTDGDGEEKRAFVNKGGQAVQYSFCCKKPLDCTRLAKTRQD